MDSFIYSKVLPNNSITNPAVNQTDYLDNNSPFSFFDFLKYTKADYNPAQFNDLYINYIKEWNSIKSLNTSKINDTIKERYVELIKEITLKYTTSEEKRFLLNIDYNDPLDLDVIIPFYSKKIREVCTFYSEKREKLKYKIEKNKVKGTISSVEKSIFETITDTLFSDTIEVGQYQKIINNKNLIKNLDIEIEELYDLYTNYLDNDPDEVPLTYDVKNSLRTELYSSNLNKIDANIFINIEKAIQTQIFESVIVFLEEFGKLFSIDYDINAVDLNCKVGDPLSELVLTTKGKATREVELRNKLITKYIGTDFYYITTGETIDDYTFNKLFSAENPTGNLLNRHFPTTASVEESELQSIRRIGLFFTPDKLGILYFSVPEKKYKIDKSKLEPNKLYIFPDPERYGNTSGLSRKYNGEYPLIHIQDYSKSIKGLNYQSAEGDINNTPFSQDFHAYSSKSQITNTKFGNEGLNLNLSSLSNKGYLVKWASDIYGNEYGLFKAKTRKHLVDNRILEERTKNILMILDGGPAIFNSGELLPEIVASSNKAWVHPNVWSSYYYYNMLVDGSIGGYINGIMQKGMYESVIYDGKSIINEPSITFDVNFNPLDYQISDIIDGLSYSNISEDDFEYNINPNTGLNTSYDYIIDGNYYNRLTSSSFYEIKELDGNPLGNTSLYAPNGTLQYELSSIQYRVYDGGEGDISIDEVYDFKNKENFIIKQTLSESKTISAVQDEDDKLSIIDLKNKSGVIYVKNVVTNEIKPLSGHLSVQFDKYSSDIKDEIYNEVLDFGIFNDIIWIKTSNYMILDKIAYSVDDFTYSGTSNNYLQYTKTGTNVISLPFFFENRNYGLIATIQLSATISNSFLIVPSLYKFDYNTIYMSKIYPFEISSQFQNVSSLNPVKIIRINDPNLTYNSRNEKYSILATVEDQNEYPYIYNFTFDYNGNILTEDKIKLYTITSGSTNMTLNSHDENILNVNKIVYNNIQNTLSSRNIELGALIFE